MKDTLYIVSSRKMSLVKFEIFRRERKLQLDCYVIKEDKYHENISVSIPSEINWISGAVADLNQTHAFLVTNIGLVVFTEENGFECDAFDFIPFFAKHSINFVASVNNVTMFCIG